MKRSAARKQESTVESEAEPVDETGVETSERARGDKPAVARLDDCTECLQCEMRCPDFAITVDRFVPVEEE